MIDSKIKTRKQHKEMKLATLQFVKFIMAKRLLYV